MIKKKILQKLKTEPYLPKIFEIYNFENFDIENKELNSLPNKPKSYSLEKDLHTFTYDDMERYENKIKKLKKEIYTELKKIYGKMQNNLKEMENFENPVSDSFYFNNQILCILD